MNDFNPAEIRANLQRAAENVVAGANRGLLLAAEHLLGESRRLVPTEEGTLDRSGKVSTDEGSNRAAVSYNTPYAAVQHEDLTFKHDDGRQAKYLEQPMNTEAPVMAQIVQGAIRVEIGS